MFVSALFWLSPITQKKGRSLSDRSSAIGSLAEIIAGLKSAVTPSTEVLFNLLYQTLQDEDAEVYSNAAFAIGFLVEHSGHDLSSHYGAILTALRPLFNVEDDASLSIPAMELALAICSTSLRPAVRFPC